MEFHEVRFDHQPPVDSYGPGFFRVRAEVQEGPLLLGPAGLLGWTGLEDTSPLAALSGHVDLILFGTGADISPLPSDLGKLLEEAGIAAEPMATPAACRTYNVLLSESRRVALAALPL